MNGVNGLSISLLDGVLLGFGAEAGLVKGRRGAEGKEGSEGKEGEESSEGKYVGYVQKITSGAVMFVATGSASVLVNLDSHSVVSCDTVSMVRGGRLAVEYCSGDFKAYLITFSTDFVRDADLLRNMMNSFGVMTLNPVVNAGDIRIIGHCFGVIYEIFRADKLTFRAEVMKNIFEALLFAVNGLYRDKFGAAAGDSRQVEGAGSRSDDILKRFMVLVAENYAAIREVAFYAGKLCVTSKYLSHAVKSVSGELPSTLISQAVVMDAKGKLKSTQLSVTEISDSLNFPNPSFFCKYFRKHTGITPKKYRDSKVRA